MEDQAVQPFALIIKAVAIAVITSATPLHAKPPVNWDGLVQVKSKRLELVYLQPGANFRGYTKVIVDPTEVAFAKNWRRDYNRQTMSMLSDVSERDVQQAVSAGVKAAQDIFADAWAKGGYAVVTEPGPDVIRVKTSILNIMVTAPERSSMGRSYSFSNEAGHATLVVEARDSLTNALLGRAVDPKVIGDDSTTWRTAGSNRADFRRAVKDWAAVSVRGLNELKALPNINP